MTSHIVHPSTLQTGLVDGCPACESKANDPLSSLDNAHLSAAWQKMLDVEYMNTGPYRSHAEAAVCSRLYFVARFLQRVGIEPESIDPSRHGVACANCGARNLQAPCGLCGWTA